MKNLVKDYKALIFDLDGTLADTMPLHYQASQDICNKYGFDFPLDYFYSQAGRPTVDVFVDLIKILNLNLDGKDIAHQKEIRFLELLPQVKPIQKVYEIALENYGKKAMAIGSGGDRKTVELTLETLNCKHLFSAIVSANDVQNHKPFPETFLRCAELMGVNPKNCIVFEDGPPGIVAAKAAGMAVIDIREFI